MTVWSMASAVSTPPHILMVVLIVRLRMVVVRSVVEAISIVSMIIFVAVHRKVRLWWPGRSEGSSCVMPLSLLVVQEV
uniref:Uncharacterized protein n=1 Tax=Anguilla anguilla TaxID=7936 RepID=A0A0E9S2G0_ANGAN